MSFSPAAIKEVLYFPTVSKCPYQKYIDSKEVARFLGDLKETIAIRNPTYAKGSLCKGSMRDEARFWALFANSNITPSTHEATASWALQVQIYCIIKNTPFDAVPLIYNSLKMEMRKTTVCLPCLITKLCLKPIPEDLRRTVTSDDEEEALVVPQKKTTKATPSKSSTPAHVLARRTVPPPTKVKKDAPVAAEEGASSEKPITLSDRKEESDDNEPLAKRLKAGRTSASKPAAKETSPSSSDSTFSDVPPPPSPPTHSSPPPILQPSSRQQQGEGRTEKEAVPAAETPVAEKEAQPQKKADRGKGILVEPLEKKKKPTGPRQINLGRPLSYPVILPDTSRDEAFARALAEEESLAVPPLMEEHTEAAPSSSQPPEAVSMQTEDEPRPTPVVPPVVGSSQQNKQTTSSPVTAIPLPTKKKSQIGIAEIFEMMGKRIEKLLPAKQSLPQLDMTSTNEELKALRDGLEQLSASFNNFQEQQKEEREQQLSTIRTTIQETSDASYASTFQAVKGEIRRASDSLILSNSLHNHRAEHLLSKLLLKHSEERKETKEAIKAFGTFLEGRIYELEMRLSDVEGQIIHFRTGRTMMRSTINYLVAVINDLLKDAEKWLLESEVRRLRDQLRKRPLTQEAAKEAEDAQKNTTLGKRRPQ
ncbi:patellin-2-like [Gastrolobium bilobum]|uniref:patellin-2-like n=1 Tax=Gastrolobium bilobum TaxID=150636 RepID=UPI002AB2C873|nr:patellin-2-like [Gastrolobium bilobum]